MKNATKYYAAGVLTGIILGVSIVLIIQSGQNKPGRLQITERETLVHEQNDAETKQKPQRQKTQAPENVVATIDSTTTDSTQNNMDSLYTDSINSLAIAQDSLTTPADSSKEEEDIVVMEDRLIATTRLPIYATANVSPRSKGNKNLDSLLIDDKYTNNENPESLTVEFWKSPINYKGYRRIHTRLVIFGLTAADSIRIFKREDQLFMNVKNKDFPINETDEFRSIWFED